VRAFQTITFCMRLPTLATSPVVTSCRPSALNSTLLTPAG
jgi:hypothetical protein